jgi:hypothetical protein
MRSEPWIAAKPNARIDSSGVKMGWKVMPTKKLSTV